MLKAAEAHLDCAAAPAHRPHKKGLS